LVAPNAGPISPEEQQLLRTSAILVAGCGNVGGAVVDPLVRLGAENLILAEPGVYSMSTLNRQNVRLQDFGRNKGEVIQERVHDTNPYASVRLERRGVLNENVEELVRGAKVIVDSVFADKREGITPTLPMRAKYALHEYAKRFQIPVIGGYPVAGLLLLLINDYRRPGSKILYGKIRGEDVDQMEPGEFLRRLIPVAAVPYEMAHELRLQLRGLRGGIPQLVYPAQLFGVIATRVIVDLLAGRAVRSRIIVDVTDLPRRWPARLKTSAARYYNLLRLSIELKQSSGAVRSITGGDD
jgi:hypothetical protein